MLDNDAQNEIALRKFGPEAAVVLFHWKLSSAIGSIDLDGYKAFSIDEDEPALAKSFGILAARRVLLCIPPGGECLPEAMSQAAMLIDAGASAVGIVELNDEGSSRDKRAQLDTALRQASVRALPAQGTCPGRAVLPWRGESDAVATFAAARAMLARYLADSDVVLDTILLWCLHAWALSDGRQTSEISPRLVLQADDARVLGLVAWLTPSPLIVSHSVATHLLPAIAAGRPTLLLDDVGGTMLHGRDMRRLIAAGAYSYSLFLAAQAQRLSCSTPTAIATTSALPDEILNRAIVLHMTPARAHATFGEPPPEILTLRAQMQAFAMQVPNDIEKADAAVLPSTLSRLVHDNWQPLVRIANCLAHGIVERAVSAAVALSASEPPPATDHALLADIRASFGHDTTARIPTARIIERLIADPEGPWARIRRGRPIDAPELAARLRRFGVKPVSIRLANDQVVRGYRGEELANAFARYLGAPVTECSGDVAAV